MVVARQMQENLCPICLDNEDGVGEAPPVVCSVCGQLYGAPFDVVLDDGSELNTLAMGMLSELQKCNAIPIPPPGTRVTVVLLASTATALK